MALDGLLCGATTFALGFTTKAYLEGKGAMSRAEMRRQFKSRFAEGKRIVRHTQQGAPKGT